MDKSTTKICSECNAAFECNPSGCWCMELPSLVPVISGVDCFCPNCLKKKIEAQVNKKQE